MRLPSTVTLNPDASTTTVVRKSAAAHVERFSAATCADPRALADALTRLQKSVADLAGVAYASPVASGTLYRNLVAGTAGAKVTIKHSLGRVAQWAVVGWRGASTVTGYQFVEDALDTSPATDTTTLALRSYTAGTFDLLVF